MLLASTVPNDNGEYTFEGLPEGEYQVEVVIDDLEPEATDEIPLAEDETITDIDFTVEDGKIVVVSDTDPISGTEDILDSGAGMIIYPNPFTDVLRIAVVETLRATSLQIQVINTAGATVHTQKITNPDATIHLGHLPVGMYIIRIENNGTIKTIKIQ